MNFDKLAKVLALAGSDNDSEALEALRKARRMLTAAGLDFVDVASAMQEQPADLYDTLEELEETVLALRREVRQLKAENRKLKHANAQPAASLAGPADATKPTAAALLSDADARRRIAELEAEIARLRVAAATARRQVDEVGEEKARLAEERDRLLAEARSLSMTNNRLRQAIEAGEREIQGLKSNPRLLQKHSAGSASRRRQHVNNVAQYNLF